MVVNIGYLLKRCPDTIENHGVPVRRDTEMISNVRHCRLTIFDYLHLLMTSCFMTIDVCIRAVLYCVPYPLSGTMYL